MTAISKNVNIDKLDDIVNKCVIHIAQLQVKLFDVKPSMYMDSSKEIDSKDAKFKNDDIVRISKYENIFAKGYVPN